MTKQESVEEGVVIGEEVGMRMKVGEWISSWLCREEGVRLPQENGESEGDRLLSNIVPSPLLLTNHMINFNLNFS